MVERDIANVDTRVRFPSSAQKMPGRSMVGHQTLDLGILGSTPSPAASKKKKAVYRKCRTSFD